MVVDTDTTILYTNYKEAVEKWQDLFVVSTPQEIANEFCRPCYDEGEGKMYYPQLKGVDYETI